jgi:DNA-binding NarL/FixJ family response regulator
MIEVFLAVSDPMVRAGVRASLGAAPGFTIVGEAHSAHELLHARRSMQADVLLLDRELRGLDALAFLERTRVQEGCPRVVLLSDDDRPEQIQAAFNRGAYGYILKRIDPTDLPGSVRQSLEGTAYHAHGLPGLADDATARAGGLTDRELVVIRAVARGLSNSAVGRELWVTEQTVKFHLTNVYRKVGVDNRTAAVRWAIEHGLV